VLQVSCSGLGAAAVANITINGATIPSDHLSFDADMILVNVTSLLSDNGVYPIEWVIGTQISINATDTDGFHSNTALVGIVAANPSLHPTGRVYATGNRTILISGSEFGASLIAADISSAAVGTFPCTNLSNFTSTSFQCQVTALHPTGPISISVVMKGGYLATIADAIQFASPQEMNAGSNLASYLSNTPYSITFAIGVLLYSSDDVALFVRDVRNETVACATANIVSGNVVCGITSATFTQLAKDNVIQGLMILGGYFSSSVLGYLHSGIPLVSSAEGVAPLYGIRQAEFYLKPSHFYSLDSSRNSFELSFGNSVHLNCILTPQNTSCRLSNFLSEDLLPGEVEIVSLKYNGYASAVSNVSIGAVITPLVTYVQYDSLGPLPSENVTRVQQEIVGSLQLADEDIRVLSSTKGPNKRSTYYLVITTMTPAGLSMVSQTSDFRSTVIAALAAGAPEMITFTVILPPSIDPSTPSTEPLPPGVVAGITTALLVVVVLSGAIAYVLLSRRDRLKKHSARPKKTIIVRRMGSPDLDGSMTFRDPMSPRRSVEFSEMHSSRGRGRRSVEIQEEEEASEDSDTSSIEGRLNVEGSEKEVLEESSDSEDDFLNEKQDKESDDDHAGSNENPAEKDDAVAVAAVESGEQETPTINQRKRKRKKRRNKKTRET
jgi:hypothetical protein